MLTSSRRRPCTLLDTRKVWRRTNGCSQKGKWCIATRFVVTLSQASDRLRNRRQMPCVHGCPAPVIPALADQTRSSFMRCLSADAIQGNTTTVEPSPGLPRRQGRPARKDGSWVRPIGQTHTRLGPPRRVDDEAFGARIPHARKKRLSSHVSNWRETPPGIGVPALVSRSRCHAGRPPRDAAAASLSPRRAPPTRSDP